MRRNGSNGIARSSETPTPNENRHVDMTAKVPSCAIAAVAIPGSSATARCGMTKNSSASDGNSRLPITAMGMRMVSRNWNRACTTARAQNDRGVSVGVLVTVLIGPPPSRT